MMISSVALAQDVPVLLDEPLPDDGWELAEDGTVQIPDTPDLERSTGRWISGDDEIFVTYVSGFVSQEARQRFMDGLNQELAGLDVERLRLPNYRDYRAYDGDGAVSVVLPHGPGILTVTAKGESRLDHLERTISWQRRVVPVDDLAFDGSEERLIVWYVVGGVAVLVALLLARQRYRRKQLEASLAAQAPTEPEPEETLPVAEIVHLDEPLPSPFLDEE